MTTSVLEEAQHLAGKPAAKPARSITTLVPYMLVGPKLAIFLSVLLAPILYTGYLSVRSGSALGGEHFTGLQNFRHILADPVFRISFVNTLIYSAIVIPATLGVALVIAAIMNQQLRFRTVTRVALILPTVTPTVACAIVWTNMLSGDNGAVNSLLRSIGIGPVLWLGNSAIVMPVIAGVEFWRGIGFYVIIFLAGIRAIPAHLYEAAALDGVTGVAAFFKITVPLLRPVLAFAIVMSTIFSFQVFDTPFVMTQGGPGYSSTTIVQYIYESAFQLDNMGPAAAMSFVLMLCILGLSVVQLSVFRRTVQY